MQSMHYSILKTTIKQQSLYFLVELNFGFSDSKHHQAERINKSVVNAETVLHYCL